MIKKNTSISLSLIPNDFDNIDKIVSEMSNKFPSSSLTIFDNN